MYEVRFRREERLKRVIMGLVIHGKSRKELSPMMTVPSSVVCYTKLINVQTERVLISHSRNSSFRYEMSSKIKNRESDLYPLCFIYKEPIYLDLIRKKKEKVLVERKETRIRIEVNCGPVFSIKHRSYL